MPRLPRHARSSWSVSCTLVAVSFLMSARAHAVSPDVVISQVYGGGGNSGATLRNDFIELFNRGGVAVNLSTWSVQYGPAAAGSWQRTNLTGVIQPGQYFLVQEAMGASGTVNLPTPDAIGTIAMGANSGIVALVNTQTTLPGGCAIGNASLVDLVGYGATTCAELASTAQLAATTAAIRSNGGCTDSDSNQADFGVSAPTPRNTSSPLGSCAELAPAVTGSSPANGATNVSPGTTISVSFSEPVSVAAGAVRVECPSGTLVASNAGALGPVTNLTIEPAQDLPIGSCRVLVQASGISDSDASDPPDHPAADFIATFTASFASCAAADTPIGQIQGTGTSAALTGVRTVQGVVVADYETPNPSLSANYLRGFFLQNAPSAGDDGNPNTSDGIFVFSGDSNFVKVGEVVQVTGNVVEFNFGLGGGPTLTELSSPTIEICGSGASLTPTDVTLPFGDATTLERYEGMLVRFPQTLYVTEHFQLGRFGQILVSSGNRLQTPTSAADPGAPALAVEAANSLNTLIVDDDLQLQNPDPIRLGRGGGPMTAMNPLRGGDTIANLMGVLTQTDATSDSNVTPTNDPAVYRLRPFNVLGEVNPNFQAVNLRPAVPVVTTGSLKVAGFNLLNYFNTFGTTACKFGVGGATAECRGAENQTEFDRQWPKTVAAAIGTGADVLVVNEMENDGYAADSALQDLVNRLNTATAPGTYTFIPVDANVGQTNALGTDAIKVGIIYKPAKATPIGSTAALNTGAFGIFQTASEGNIGRSRPALAQAFSDSCGGKVVVVGNHLKSKGSSCEGNISPVPSDPDALDGQGNCNLTRKAAAEQLLSWLGTDPTHTSVSNVLILGDFNSYSHEDPIKAIVTGGYTNLIASEIGPDAYSYVFDGGWGYLDYAFASPSLLNQIDDVVEMHINADEPGVLDYNTNFKSAGQLVSLYANDAFRASDHDPVVVGLTLTCAASHGVPATRDWHTTLLLLTLLLFGAAAVSARRFVQR